MAKKIDYRETYERGTTVTSKEDVIDWVKKASKIEIHHQTKYEDGSEDVKITITVK